MIGITTMSGDNPLQQPTHNGLCVLESGHIINFYQNDNASSGLYDLLLDVRAPDGHFLEQNIVDSLPYYNGYVAIEQLGGNQLAVSWVEDDGSITAQYYTVDPAAGVYAGPPNQLFLDAVIGHNYSGEVVGILAARDPDDLDISYSILGGHSHFHIEGNLLILDSPLDPNNLPPLDLTIVASDPGGNTLEHDFTVRIKDYVNELAPMQQVYNNVTIPPPTDSALTDLTNGNYVLTWNVENVGAQGLDIFGQVFNADGTPVTVDPFLINSAVTDNQDSVSLTGLEGGGFVATYRSDGGDGQLSGVMATIYNADGTVATPEFVVNTDTAGNQEKNTVSALASGGFVVAWASEAAGVGDVRYQLFGADGTKLGSELTANETTTGLQVDPDITQLTDGTILVTWTSNLLDGSSSEILGRLFDPATGNALGSEFSISDDLQGVSGDHEDSQVTSMTDGGFAVTWFNPAEAGQSHYWDASYFAIYDYDAGTHQSANGFRRI